MKMKTMADENEARGWMIARNRAALDCRVFVMVDGPEDGEFTVMELREAVEGDFAYRWEV